MNSNQGSAPASVVGSAARGLVVGLVVVIGSGLTGLYTAQLNAGGLAGADGKLLAAFSATVALVPALAAFVLAAALVATRSLWWPTVARAVAVVIVVAGLVAGSILFLSLEQPITAVISPWTTGIPIYASQTMLAYGFLGAVLAGTLVEVRGRRRSDA